MRQDSTHTTAAAAAAAAAANRSKINSTISIASKQAIAVQPNFPRRIVFV